MRKKNSTFTTLDDLSLKYLNFAKKFAPPVPEMCHLTQFPQNFPKAPIFSAFGAEKCVN